MKDNIPKASASTARALRWTGIIVFSVSFLTPDIQSSQAGMVVSTKDWGFAAFLMTPILVFRMLGDIAGMGDLLSMLLLAAAWGNNFSVFCRFPPLMAWIPISIPWILLASAASGWIHLGSLWAYEPFYPWAFGISLIHASAYLETAEVFNKWITQV